MTAPKAIRAAYTEIKMVKTRSVYQVVLEGPLEQMEDAIKMLGIPKPGSETWVAVAMLTETAAEPKGGKLAQSAAMLCNEGGFRRYLAETGDFPFIAMLDLDMATDELRRRCGVDSRAELDHDEDAAKSFLDLRAGYDLWRRDAA